MHPGLRVAVALIGSLAAGVAMSFGQTYLPPVIAPLANSAAPVVALAAAAALAGRRWWSATVLGSLAGPLAIVGYYTTSLARGYGVSPTWVFVWCAAGLAFGSVMGAAVWLLRTAGTKAWLRGIAAGFWPGIAVGEAAHGIVRVSDSTPVAYWTAQCVIAAVVLLVLVRRCVSAPRDRALGALTAVVLAGVVFAAYGLL